MDLELCVDSSKLPFPSVPAGSALALGQDPEAELGVTEAKAQREGGGCLALWSFLAPVESLCKQEEPVMPVLLCWDEQGRDEGWCLPTSAGALSASQISSCRCKKQVVPVGRRLLVRALGLLQCQGGALCYHRGILEDEALREVPLIPGHVISLYMLAVLLILNSALLPRAGN